MGARSCGPRLASTIAARQLPVFLSVIIICLPLYIVRSTINLLVHSIPPVLKSIVACFNRVLGDVEIVNGPPTPVQQSIQCALHLFFSLEYATSLMAGPTSCLLRVLASLIGFGLTVQSRTQGQGRRKSQAISS